MNDICSQCIEGGASCCHHPRIVVTIADLRRSGLPAGAAAAVLTVREYLDEDAWDADWAADAVLMLDGRRYELCLKKNADGSCIMLTERGCRLGERRPLGCRIFPYWVDRGRLCHDRGGGFGCRMFSEDISTGLALLGETEGSVLSYHSRIKAELRADYQTRQELAARLLRGDDCGVESPAGHVVGGERR